MSVKKNNSLRLIFPFSISKGCFLLEEGRNALKGANYKDNMVDDFFDIVRQTCSGLFVKIPRARRLIKIIMLVFSFLLLLGFCLLIGDTASAATRAKNGGAPISMLFFLGAGLILTSSVSLCSSNIFINTMLISKKVEEAISIIDEIIERENHSRFKELGMEWRRSHRSLDWIELIIIDETSLAAHRLKQGYISPKAIDLSSAVERSNMYVADELSQSQLIEVSHNQSVLLQNNQSQIVSTRQLNESSIPITILQNVEKPLKNVRFFDIKRRDEEDADVPRYQHREYLF